MDPIIFTPVGLFNMHLQFPASKSKKHRKRLQNAGRIRQTLARPLCKQEVEIRGPASALLSDTAPHLLLYLLRNKKLILSIAPPVGKQIFLEQTTIHKPSSGESLRCLLSLRIVRSLSL